MAQAWVLGVAWGVLLGLPFARRARRAGVVARAIGPDRRHLRAARRWRASTSRVARCAARLPGPAGRVATDLRVRRRARRAEHSLARELPVVLDLLGVAVDAGSTPYVAVETASRWAPPLGAGHLGGVLRACALGVGFADALRRAADAAPRLAPLADALLTSDRLGAPVGPALARLAAEERAALRRRAEAHARRVPVRLLFPLVFMVLPAFVLLTVVPGLAAGLARL